jgi:hypothetical protein
MPILAKMYCIRPEQSNASGPAREHVHMSVAR